MLRGPGVSNLDVLVFKSFDLRENVRFQLRAEAYNGLTHMQWAGVDMAARFDNGGNPISSSFGQINSARSPRMMQFAVRLLF